MLGIYIGCNILFHSYFSQKFDIFFNCLPSLSPILQFRVNQDQQFDSVFNNAPSNLRNLRQLLKQKTQKLQSPLDKIQPNSQNSQQESVIVLISGSQATDVCHSRDKI